MNNSASLKIVFGLILVAMAMLPVFLKLPFLSSTWGALNDSAHTGLFLLLSLGLAVLLKLPSQITAPRKAWLVMWAGLLAAGLSIEFVQSFIGRSASLTDVLLDCLGITAGSLLYLAWHQRRWGYAVIAVLVCSLAFVTPAVVAYYSYLLKRQLPIVCNFDGPCPWALAFYTASFKTIKVNDELSAKWPGNGTEFGYISYGKGSYPGVGLKNVFTSWQGYIELCADIYLPDAADTRLGVQIFDIGYPGKSRKFDRHVNVKVGANTVCVPLADVGKLVDLKAAKTLMYYRINPHAAGELYIDNIRLH